MRLIFVTTLALFAAQAFAANGTMKGDGSAENPFQIEDYEDLKAIGKGDYLYSSNYILTKDIDASASKNENCKNDECSGFTPIGRNKDAAGNILFDGTFEGQNHTISNLDIRDTVRGDSLGLFSSVRAVISNLKFDKLTVIGDGMRVGGLAGAACGTVNNVHVTNGFVQGGRDVGGLVGAYRFDDYGLTFQDVSYQGDVTGGVYVGGIVSNIDVGSIVNASVDVNIVASDNAGGIVGYIEHGEVINSRSSGTITPMCSRWTTSKMESCGGVIGEFYGYDGFFYKKCINCVSSMDILKPVCSRMDVSEIEVESVGGIVGENIHGVVFLSHATGNIEGDEDVGGIVGRNNGKIIYSYANGSAKGVDAVGGAVGFNAGDVQNIYAQGSVEGVKNVGGLVGLNGMIHGSILNSYAATTIKGNEDVGGLVGKNEELVENSYWDMEISGLSVGSAGKGLSTSEMMTKSSFVDWDTVGYYAYAPCEKKSCEAVNLYTLEECLCKTDKFINVWAFDEGKSYPYFNKNVKFEDYFIYVSEESVAVRRKTVAKTQTFGAKFQGQLISLRFEIPTAASVKFSLVDMQGRVVRAFDLGRRATGAHFESLDAGEIARGRYVGMLHVDGKATEKVMLLKK